jgi:SAM-dependent methyltransferase
MNIKNDNSIFLKKLRSLKTKNSDIWINEALFGFYHIKEYCKKLEGNNKVLEIGSGSGILLNLLSENFKDIIFEGIEPFGEGFSSLNYLNSFSRENGVSIKNIGYEELSSNNKYDLIFCINVFEHLNDWRNFLEKISFLLNGNGKLIVLCPNYGFPYESHFRIPVLFNKKITFFFFKKFIRKFENKNDCLGLWESLNFVKKRDVIDYLKDSIYSKSLAMKDNLSILDFMVNRITSDREFRKRQRIIGTIAIALKGIGILNIFKLFPNFIPYMKLEFSRK